MNEQKDKESTQSFSTSSIFRPPVLSFTASYPSNGLSVPKVLHAPTFTPPSISPIVTAPCAQSSTETKRSEQGVPQDYVFGSNISSRVVNADVPRGATENLGTKSGDNHTLNASVFTTLAKAVSSNSNDDQNSATLEDSATKLSEAQKRPVLQEVELFTGEEGEVPVVREHCRTYLFNNEKRQWNSLGPSHLHLNDVNHDAGSSKNVCNYRSRIVVRLATTKRVVLNTLVWAQMPIALVDTRNLRLGTVSEDGGHIRTFLFKFPSGEPAENLYNALVVRKERLAPEQSTSRRKRPASDSPCESNAKMSVGLFDTPPTCSSSDITSSTSAALINSKGSHCTIEQPLTHLSRTYSHVPRVQFKASPLDSITKCADQTKSGNASDPQPTDSCHHTVPRLCIDLASDETLSASQSIATSLLQIHPKPTKPCFSLQWYDLSLETDEILEINCQIYHFDEVSSHWSHHGIAAIRLHDIVSPNSDPDSVCSRILIQFTSHKHPSVIASLYPEAAVRLIDEKAILIVTTCYHDFSGDSIEKPMDVDSQEPTRSAFLLTSSSGEIERLHKLLVSRLNAEGEKSDSNEPSDHAQDENSADR